MGGSYLVPLVVVVLFNGTRVPGLFRLQCSTPPWPPIDTQRSIYCYSLLSLELESKLESKLNPKLESQLESDLESELEQVVDLDVEVHAMERT